MSHDKKKKKTLIELAVGGGLMVIFLPLILLAVFWTIVAIGLGLMFTFVLSASPTIFLPMLLVYGALLAIMIFVGLRFSQRFRVLFQRWRGIRQERRRVAEEMFAAEVGASLVDDAEKTHLAFEERTDFNAKAR